MTVACEHALRYIKGFQWLTHVVNYRAFPDSLKVICVFDTNESLSGAFESGDDEKLRRLIEEGLLSAGVRVADIERVVSFTTEERGISFSADSIRRLH